MPYICCALEIDLFFSFITVVFLSRFFLAGRAALLAYLYLPEFFHCLFLHNFSFPFLCQYFFFSILFVQFLFLFTLSQFPLHLFSFSFSLLHFFSKISTVAFSPFPLFHWPFFFLLAHLLCKYMVTLDRGAFWQRSWSCEVLNIIICY